MYSLITKNIVDMWDETIIKMIDGREVRYNSTSDVQLRTLLTIQVIVLNAGVNMVLGIDVINQL